MKKIFALFAICALTGCATVENPYQNYSKREMSTVSTNDLCRVATNMIYKPSYNVPAEMRRRHLQDCSSGEVYCRNLGLNYGTDAYANCRISYQKLELQRQMANDSQRNEEERLRLEREALKQRYVQPTYTSTTYTAPGYSSHISR